MHVHHCKDDEISKIFEVLKPYNNKILNIIIAVTGMISCFVEML